MPKLGRTVALIAAAAFGGAAITGTAAAAPRGDAGLAIASGAAGGSSVTPVSYVTTVRSGVGLLGGTIDIGNHCGSEIIPPSEQTPCTTRVQFPFPVTFYGVTYTSAMVDAAGDVQFTGDLSRVMSGGCFPDSTTGAAFAVYSSFFMTTSEQPHYGIFTGVHGTAPNRTFVIEWRTGLTGNSSYAPYAEWNFEARFVEGSGTVTAVFGDSFRRMSFDNWETFQDVHPAPWRGVNGVQDGMGRATGGCATTDGTGSTPVQGVAISYVPSSNPPTILEQDDASARYTGTWVGGRCGTIACSPDNKQMNSSAAASKAKLTYTGKRADWIASRGPNGGKVGVYVDGVLKTTVNLYSPVIVDGMTVYSGPVKATGSHTLELRRVSGRINVDSFRVYR